MSPRVRCPLCGKAITLTKSGAFRRHTDPRVRPFPGAPFALPCEASGARP